MGYRTEQCTKEHFPSVNYLTVAFIHSHSPLRQLSICCNSEYCVLVPEQRRLVDRYTAELCAVMDSEQTRWGCDVILDTRLLNIPIVPCNFIPIEAQLYLGRPSVRL